MACRRSTEKVVWSAGSWLLGLHIKGSLEWESFAISRKLREQSLLGWQVPQKSNHQKIQKLKPD